MDATSLLLSLFFGAVGMGFVLYAKSMGKLVPAVAGVGLMVPPYFLSSVVALLVVCAGLTAMPFVFRDA